MELTIRHVTRYDFCKPVLYNLQQLRMHPKSRAGQVVRHWAVHVQGGDISLAYQDQHNNHVDLAVLAPNATHVEIVSEGVVETVNTHGIVGQQGGHVPLWMFLRPTELTKPGKRIAALAKDIGDASSVAGLHALSAAILGAMPYQIEDTGVSDSAEDALTRGHGVCMDHAHVFIAAARKLGIPARYVSGYLMIEGGGEQTASHAWAEAHVENLGWVGFDISNGISPDDRYVRVATGLDYRDAAPVSGISFGDHSENLVVSVSVEQ